MEQQFSISLKLTNNNSDIEIYTIGGKFGDQEFYEAIKCFKKVGGEWDKDSKIWIIPVEATRSLINQLDKNLSEVTINSIGYSSFEEFLSEIDSIIKNKYKQELIRTTVRRPFNQELMNFPPLVGKHPFEDFQRMDIQRALNQNRFIFNWEMGLGKSYATAALFVNLEQYNCVEKAVLLTSGIGTYNLKEEILKLTKNLKDEDILVCRNTGEARKVKFEKIIDPASPHKIFITTYSVIKSMENDFLKKESNRKKIKKAAHIPFDQWSSNIALFLDESHNLGNSKSQQTKCVDKHKKYFNYIYEFTGTFADKYEKIYPQIKIIDASLVKGQNFESWVLEYGDIGTKWSDYAPNPAAWDIIKLEELNKSLTISYSAKRKMDECLDIPIDYEVPTFKLNMGEKHRKLYQYFIEEEMSRIQEEAKEQGKSVMSIVLNQFSWLQSACENPNVLRRTRRFNEFPDQLKKMIEDFDFIKDNTKVPLWDEIIEERCDENDQKGIIWCAHQETIDALAEHYKKYNPYVIDSSTEDKMGMVNNFKKDSKSKLIITSIYVLNTSVTITEAKFNLYAERCFNFTIYSQSRGRIHRPGKTEISRTYQMVFDKSTDAILDANLTQKGQMINKILSKNFFTQNEWKSFFSFRFGSSY